MSSVVCALVLLGSLAVPSFAEEQGEEQRPEGVAAEHGEALGEDEFQRHHLSVFLGVTDGEVENGAEPGAESEGSGIVVEDESAFTMGLDYVYRLNRRWGVGALVDFAAGDLRSWVFGIPVSLHPAGGWDLFVAPGFEDKADKDREFLMRAGVSYHFEVGRFTVAPALQVDFVDGEEIPVYGVNIGREF
jgi:hypothetical protein